jgi:type IV secretion system protein VirB11
MLNGDGAVWIDCVGAGMSKTGLRMHPGDAERLLRLLTSEMSVELAATSPSLAAKLLPSSLTGETSR